MVLHLPWPSAISVSHESRLRSVLVLIVRRLPVIVTRDLQTAPARYLLGWRRHADLEDAVLEARFRLIGHRPFRQGDLAEERSVHALVPVHTAVLFPVLLLPLAGDRDRVIADFDDDVIGLDAGQIGADDEFVASLDDVDLRHPCGDGARRLPAARSGGRRAAAQLVEEARDV